MTTLEHRGDVLILDGAMGTELQRRGVSHGWYRLERRSFGDPSRNRAKRA